jgi:hypothetical protein
MAEIVGSSRISEFSPVGYEGITEEDLRKIVVRGIGAANNATLNHPRNAAGSFAYHERVKAARDLFGPFGWTRYSKKGIEYVVCPNKQIAIVMSSADGNVGRPGGLVTTKYPKGHAYEDVIAANCDWLGLTNADGSAYFHDEEESFVTWFLLTCKVGDNVFWELSLPARIELGGRIENWERRILFAPVEVNLQPNYDPADQEPDIEVSVNKKTI